ncbi:hypothetical protein K2P56_03755 [Patescibacteria group bacterium]|nr:hypothetical protein [Patescibacteria group bacterium]
MLKRKEFLTLAMLGVASTAGIGIGTELARRHAAAQESALVEAKREGFAEAICGLDRNGYLDDLPESTNFPDDASRRFNIVRRDC